MSVVRVIIGMFKLEKYLSFLVGVPRDLMSQILQRRLQTNSYIYIYVFIAKKLQLYLPKSIN
jgi:hypothetical protein